MVGAVLAVVGGAGGLGASSFAAALALVSGAMLLDLDPVGGGIDVLLGVDRVAGARWSGLRLGGGALEPRLLADGVPRWRGIGVLALDAQPPPVDAVGEVIVAARHLGPVVLNLGREPSSVRQAGLAAGGLTVVMTAGRIPTLAASRAVRTGLGDRAVGIVVRRGVVPPAEAAALVGGELLGRLPSRPSVSSTRADRRLARGIWSGRASS